MPECPPWCIPLACSIDRPPVGGFLIATHCSAPRMVDELALRLVQPLGARVPRLEFRFGDERLAIPLVVARDLPPTIEDLLVAAGADL